MIGAGVPFAAQRRNRHRQFTLAIDLDEALAHGRDGIADIGKIHRPAAIDDGADPLAVLAALLRGIDQPPHHGGGREHHDIVELPAEIEHFIRIEAAGFGNDVPAAHADMGEIVEAGAMRDRRGVERGVQRRGLIDIGEIA